MEDFSSIDSIKSRFEEWKNKHEDCYRNAYISLCLPKLFAPFIRLQLLDWNPFEVQLIPFLWKRCASELGKDMVLVMNTLPHTKFDSSRLHQTCICFFLTWMLHTVTLSGVLWRHQAFRSMTLQTIRGTWWKPKRNIIWMFFFTDWTITLIDIVGLQWVTFLSLRRWEVQLFRLKVLLFVSSIFSLRENFRYILSVFCWPVSWKRLKLLSSFCRHILVLVIRATLCPTMNSQYLFLQTKTYLDMDSWYHILLICDLVLFQAKCLEIEDFRWYKSLVLFGCGNDPYDIDVDDPDVKLIPIVLEKSLIPKLTGIKFLFHWFLPMSVSLKAAWSWLFQFILPCERKYLYIEGFLKNGSFVR